MNKSDKILANIEKLFKKYQLSGLITIPQQGTFSLFASEGEKLILLQHAKIELKKIDLEIEALASYTQSDNLKSIKPNYV